MIYIYRLYPCAIPDEDTVLLTGGYLGRRTVSRYNRDGWMEESFPILNEGRYMHGCAAFIMDLEPVRGRRYKHQSNFYYVQVFLVVGGRGSTSRFLDSTEVFGGPSGQWVTMKPLPVAVRGLAGAKISNTVFMFGMFFNTIMVNLIMCLSLTFQFCFRWREFRRIQK